VVHGNVLLAGYGYIITILKIKVKRVKPSLTLFPCGFMLAGSSHGYRFTGSLGYNGDVYLNTCINAIEACWVTAEQIFSIAETLNAAFGEERK
jgi:hypothetical protein